MTTTSRLDHRPQSEKFRMMVERRTQSQAPQAPPPQAPDRDDGGGPPSDLVAMILNCHERATGMGRADAPPIDHLGRPLPADSIAAFIVTADRRQRGEQ